MAARGDNGANRRPERSRHALDRLGDAREHALSSALDLDDFARLARGKLPRPVSVSDSGFRRGTDVLKALALGADVVLIGRPFLFAAAVAGTAGGQRAIRILSEEIDLALLGAGVCHAGAGTCQLKSASLFTGANDPGEVGPEALREAITPARMGEPA